MNSYFVFKPNNPILEHCFDSYMTALKDLKKDDFVQGVGKKTFLMNFIKPLINSVKLSNNNGVFVFLLAFQMEYLPLMIFLKGIARIFSTEITIYYLMHEPKLEQGRVNFWKSSLIFMHHIMTGKTADAILLPSNIAMIKAKSFIPNHKQIQINLAFDSPSNDELKKSLDCLKFSWDDCKTFSMICTVSSPDKNPWAFVDFACNLEQKYPQRSRFIRAGRDRHIDVFYDEELIIRFPSFISQKTKHFLINQTHFMVIPYTFSTQSGVIAEALSYGKLLILNDIPAFAHLRNYSFIFMVDFQDESSMLKCAQSLFNMTVHDYEERYWEAVKYFHENHSHIYLEDALNKVL